MFALFLRDRTIRHPTLKDIHFVILGLTALAVVCCAILLSLYCCGCMLTTRTMIFMLILHVSSITLAAICYGVSQNLKARQIFSRLSLRLQRILFYGMPFLISSMFANGHAFYLRARQTLGYEHGMYCKYVACHYVCDSLGYVCSLIWVLWIWWTIVSRIAKYVHAKFLMHLVKGAGRKVPDPNDPNLRPI